MSNALNQFEAFKTILHGNAIKEQDKAKINSYLMLKWLSGDQRTIIAANTVNRFYRIPVEVQYNLFRNMLHGKLRFIRYPKGSITKNKNIEVIQKHYNVNYEEANSMLELISQDELNTLNEIYGS